MQINLVVVGQETARSSVMLQPLLDEVLTLKEVVTAGESRHAELLTMRQDLQIVSMSNSVVHAKIGAKAHK